MSKLVGHGGRLNRWRAARPAIGASSWLAEEGGTPLKRPTTAAPGGEERRRGRNARAEHLKRAVIRGKDTFPSVDRARARSSSMRDVDGLVKPRLRGRTTETERNDDDFLAKRPRAPVPRIQISHPDNRQVLSSLHYRSNSVSVAFNREKFTVSG